MRPLRALVILFACLCNHGALADGRDFSPESFIESMGYTAQAILRSDTLDDDQKIESIQWMLQKSVDLKFTGQRVLGPSWKIATREQRKEYDRLFSDYVLRIYPKALLQNPSEKFLVTGSRPSTSDETLVFSSVRDMDGESAEWTWRVRERDGDYKVVDLLAAGVSLTSTLREEFGSYILYHGLEGLLDKLRTTEKR